MNVLLSAEPGAGKTTRVPLALLQENWLGGQKIIMLEPRRLAARNAARFMAQQLNEAVGELPHPAGAKGISRYPD